MSSEKKTIMTKGFVSYLNYLLDWHNAYPFLVQFCPKNEHFELVLIFRNEIWLNKYDMLQ